MFLWFTKTLHGNDSGMFLQNSHWQRCLYVLPKPSLGRMFVCLTKTLNGKDDLYVLPKPSMCKMFVCFAKILYGKDVCRAMREEFCQPCSHQEEPLPFLTATTTLLSCGAHKVASAL